MRNSYCTQSAMVEREREFGKTGETEEKSTDFLIKKGGELAIGKQKNEIISYKIMWKNLSYNGKEVN